MNKETILSIDLTDVFSVENEEKLNMLSKDLLIELLLRNLDRIIKSQERISKAIEYIHWRYDDKEDMYITQMEELLKILQGEDNE